LVKKKQMKRILRKTLITLFLAVFCSSSFAQEEKLSKINLYSSFALIPGVEGLANVEVRLASTEKLTLYGRVGAGYAGWLFETEGPGGLLGVNLITGKKNHHLDIHAGMFLGTEIPSSLIILPSFDLGYRYQKPEGGFLFKAKAGVLGVGFGFGYAFKNK
jgi:hypothetical protein